MYILKYTFIAVMVTAFKVSIHRVPVRQIRIFLGNCLI